ncbi:MAG: hypothetical protein Q8M56_08665 [Desulfobacterales bacterium]|nr:hypothetical protein [Desulfobacterales bacterium]
MPESTEATPSTASSYRSNPSVEYLLANLVINQHKLELLETRYKDDAEQRPRLQLCRKSLDEAGAALMKRPFQRTFLAWGLFHQVAEEMIMFLDKEELAAEGKKIELDIKLSALPETTKSGWLAKLGEALKTLAGANPTDVEVNSARQTIRIATNALNSQTDNLFWEIWTKKFFGLIYAVMLVIGLVLFILLGSLSSGFLLCIGNVLLLGAIGGVASGILSADPQYVAKGQFWVSTLYYLLVRPTLGALAALLVFWMLQSQYLIQIKPPADCRKAVMNGLTCLLDEPQGKAAQDEPKTNTQAKAPEKALPEKPPGPEKAPQDKPQGGEKAAGTTAQIGAAEHSTMIVLNALPGQQIYLYFLVLLLAGFSGDKVLKIVADKTFAKLFAEAEKTKAAK